MARATTKNLKLDPENYRVLDAICDHITILDRDFTILFVNQTAKNIFGDNLVGRKCYQAFHQSDQPCEPSPCLCLRAFQDGNGHSNETQVISKNGDTIYLSCKVNVLTRDTNGNPVAVIEVSRDITEQRLAEEALKLVDVTLQERVKECTRELDTKNMRLSEVNTALRVLTQNLQAEKDDLQEEFLVNIKRNVEPYIEKLKQTRVSKHQLDLIATVECYLREITSTFTHNLTSTHLGLTAQELRIADLIRMGNTSKDISNLLNISTNTVDTHRRNIRKKLGFNGSRESLRARLMMIN